MTNVERYLRLQEESMRLVKYLNMLAHATERLRADIKSLEDTCRSISQEQFRIVDEAGSVWASMTPQEMGEANNLLKSSDGS